MARVSPDKLTVSGIKSRLLNISQTSLYRLNISVPEEVKRSVGIDIYDIDDINLLCSNASLPGSSLATHDQRNDYHGVTEKMAYRRIYDETLSLTFYVDREYHVIKLFEGWVDFISGSDDRFGSAYVNHRVQYPKDYKEDIFLTKFERDHLFWEKKDSTVSSSKTVLEYRFVKAFPLNIVAIPVSYDGSELLKCNVAFSFIRYVTNERALVPGDLRDPLLGAPDLLGTAAGTA